MKTNSAFLEFINEIKSYNFEKLLIDRNIFGLNIKSSKHFLRLIEFNQLNGVYEKKLNTLTQNAYHELTFWELDEINSAYYLIIEELDIIDSHKIFNKLFFYQYSNKNTEYQIYIDSKEEYFNFIFSLSKEFNLPLQQVSPEIFESFATADESLSFDINDPLHGNITDALFNDLSDGLMLKENALYFLIEKIEQYTNKFYHYNQDFTQRGLNSGFSTESLIQICTELKKLDYLNNEVKEENFIAAFTDIEIPNTFIPIKWTQILHSALFIRCMFNTDNKELKVWYNASKLFDGGNSDSLKNAFRGIEKHLKIEIKINELLKRFK